MDDWKAELRAIHQGHDHTTKAPAKKVAEDSEKAREFIVDVVGPAFQELGEALKNLGMEAKVSLGQVSASIAVWRGVTEVLRFEILVRGAHVATWTRYLREGHQWKGEGMVGTGSLRSTVEHVKQIDVIQCFLREYRDLAG
jgi:hypothetical protein